MTFPLRRSVAPVRVRALRVFGLTSVLIALGAAATANTPVLQPVAAPPVDSAAVEWVRRNAVPIVDVDAWKDFKDLEPLKKIIGDARIVALGEGTHGTHEFFAMKRRLVEFLAKEMGFTVFAMEANVPESGLINDYVRTGNGDAATLVRGLLIWPWTTEELTDLVRWMRTYNAAGGKMRFAGVDVQMPAAAQRVVTRLLARVDSAWARRAEADYQRLSPPDRQFGLGTVAIPAARFAGKHVQLTAWVRSDRVALAYAGLHLRAEDAGGTSLIRVSSTPDAAVRSSTPWTELRLGLDVPANAAVLRAGFALFGDGTAWFDDARLTIDGESGVALTTTFESSDTAQVAIDPRSRAWPYAMERDTVAHTGAHALRIAFTGPPPLTPLAAAAAAQDVYTRLEAAKADFARALERDTLDWMLLNARMVAQSYEWRADPTPAAREVGMAQNIKWLTDRNPGAKVVVWAHNGHVSRNRIALGARLEELYPGQLMNIGFTTAGGTYNAEGATGAVGEFTMKPPPAESLESYFAATGIPRFFLDLRRASTGDSASAWIMRERPMRYIGITGGTAEFYAQPVRAFYDALIYFDQTRKSTLLK